MNVLCAITCMPCLQEKKKMKREEKTESERKNNVICFWYTEQTQWGETKPFPACWIEQYCGSEAKHTGWLLLHPTTSVLGRVFIGTGPCLHFGLWYVNSFRCMVHSAWLTFIRNIQDSACWASSSDLYWPSKIQSQLRTILRPETYSVQVCEQKHLQL